jgi:hypothetical protein
MKYKSLISYILAATFGLNGCKVGESIGSITDEPKKTINILASGKVTTFTHMSMDIDLIKNRTDNSIYHTKNAKKVNYSIDNCINNSHNSRGNMKENLIFDLIDIETLDSSHSDIPILVKYDYQSDYSPTQQDIMFHSNIGLGDTINIINSQDITKEKEYVHLDKETSILMEFYVVPYNLIFKTGNSKNNRK